MDGCRGEVTLSNPWGALVPAAGTPTLEYGAGAFSLSWKDFQLFCNTIHICELAVPQPCFQLLRQCERPRLTGVFELPGSWNVHAGTAGGHQDLATFQANPQYCLRLRCQACVSITLRQREGRCEGRRN